MPRALRIRLSSALVLAISLIWTVHAPALAASGASVILGTPIKSVFVRLPRGGTIPGKPVQVLVALHGMSSNGEDFSRDLFATADTYGWLIVAPTIDYGDWTKPEVVAREDPQLIATISEYLDALPQTVGVPTRKSVLLLGHSRGAQLAHRFAEFRPERVLAVAALSAGTYTLPPSGDTSATLAFPYGLKDMAQYGGRSFNSAALNNVRFWVGVGGLDTNPNDVPRQWDKYEGTTRLQRAQAFAAAMIAHGATAVLKVFGSARHEVTGEMRQEACSFLNTAMLSAGTSTRATSLAAKSVAY